MSSHHIVRENQEPALVILNAHAIPFEKVQELLEWMPTIMVLHSQMETVWSWGIKIDGVLVPAGEEVGWTERTRDQYPIRVIPYYAQQSPLTKAIEVLNVQHIPAVNILAANERVLHEVTSFKGDVDVFFFNKRWSRIKSGRFEKWIAAGTKIFVLPESIHSEMPELVNGERVLEKDGVVVLHASQLFWVGEVLT